jgi:hypothetical protein
MQRLGGLLPARRGSIVAMQADQGLSIFKKEDRCQAVKPERLRQGFALSVGSTRQHSARKRARALRRH